MAISLTIRLKKEKGTNNYVCTFFTFTRLDFLQSLCEKHRVLFIFDEAHRSSSVSAGKISVITQGINRILTETVQTQCVFLSATFAKRPESLITFMRRTALSALATENTLEKALHSGGVPMQEFVASSLAADTS